MERTAELELRDGKAWLCEVQKKARTIVWMSAWTGFIKATIYPPKTDLPDLLNLGLREETKKAIEDAAPVGTSIPCVFEIKKKSELRDFESVMLYKIARK